jgi:hypothetical protein
MFEGNDWGRHIAIAWQWLAEQILSAALLEALGITAAITVMVSWFTSKIIKWRDKLLFSVLTLLIILIAINSFSAHQFRPYLHIEVEQIASGAVNGSASPDTIIFLRILVTNRGTVQTIIYNVELSAKLNGREVKGIPFVGSNNIDFNGDVKALDLSENLFHRKTVLLVGIPVEGYAFFNIAGMPHTDFSNLVEYTITVSDSFGNKYSEIKESHGEMMSMPKE